MATLTKTKKIETKKKNWVEKLQARWGVSASRVFIILLVFACTGFTVMFLKKPVVAFFTGGEQSLIFSIIYYILILPIYNLILLVYGFIFGQFTFFWEFEKRFFGRIFSKKKTIKD
jgi:membrane-bound ClpP family serine protease